jgi:hypothetical protein
VSWGGQSESVGEGEELKLFYQHIEQIQHYGNHYNENIFYTKDRICFHQNHQSFFPTCVISKKDSDDKHKFSTTLMGKKL